MRIICKDILRNPFHIHSCLKLSNGDKEARIKICDIAKVVLGPKSTIVPLEITFARWNLMLLTYCMVQSPSWEANWFAASQETPRISRNPKVHYRTHKRPPPVAILGQPNPVHIQTSHLLEIRSNIIRPSTPRSPQWCLSLRFPHQDPIYPPLLT